MNDAIGALNARARLESPLRSEDDLGGAAIAWRDEGEVWAAVEAHGVRQGADYDAAPSVGGYTLHIRRRDGVRAGWRALWGARAFKVLGVRDDGGARIALICEEEIR